MSPFDAKKLNDKIEIIAKLDKVQRMDLLEICHYPNVVSLANEYKKESLMIARMIMQIKKHGTYRESKLNSFYK